MVRSIFAIYLLTLVSPPTTPSDNNSLGDPIIDGSYGYSIRPPADWRIIRQRVPERRGVTLVQMAHAIAGGQIEEIILKQSATTQSIAMDEMLKRVAQNLELEFSNLEIQSQQLQTIGGKPGAVLSATFFREGVRKLRLQAIIQHKPQSYYVILYDGPASLRKLSEPLFNMVVASFKSIEANVDEKQLSSALESGEKFLASITQEQLKKAIVPEETLQFDLDGKLIGFVLIRQAEHAREGKPGIQIRERGWTFEADGRARRLQANMYLSYDLQTEHWRTSVTTLVPEASNRPAYLEIALEEGLRAGNILLSNQAYSLNEPNTENPSIKLPDSYISRVIARMLPRLVPDLTKPQELAFVTFDHTRAGLVAKVVEFHGRAELPSGAARGSVYRVDDREGLAANPTSIYFDQSAKTVLVQAGDLKMTPTTPAAMEKAFGSRIADAEGRMAQLEASYNKDVERFDPRRKK